MLPKNLYNLPVWKKLRAKQLGKAPFCNKCGIMFNLQVDHIIEHEQKLSLFLDENNLQTLCIKCHAQKTRAYQQRNSLNKPKTKKYSNFYNVIFSLKPNNDYKLIVMLNQKKGIPLDNQYNISDLISKSYQINGYTISIKIQNDHIPQNQIKNIKVAIIKIFLKMKTYTNQIEVLNSYQYDELTNFIKSLTANQRKQNHGKI